jgi:hypothetical protein
MRLLKCGLGSAGVRRFVGPSAALVAFSLFAGVVALFLLLESASAAGLVSPSHRVPLKEGNRLRTLGMKAVMHVYYFAPKTLEITRVDSYLLKDVATCEYTLDATLTAAAARLRHGDQVEGDCASISPSTAAAQSDAERLASRLKAL